MTSNIFALLFFPFVLFFFDGGELTVQESSKKKEYVIAYNVLQNKENDDYEIYSINLDGSGKKNITNHKDVAWTYYSWKDVLFFISDRDTCHRCYFLWEMNADGGNVRKVSNLQLEDSWMGSRNDGKEIIVSARIGKEVRYQLFIINKETGTYKQLTTDTAAMYRDPTFSPDGKHIVCAYKKSRRDRTTHEELYIMDADGMNLKQLTHYPEDDTLRKSFGYKAGPPHWNAKENFITYQSEQAGKYSLYAVTPDGKKQWKLTNNPMEEGWHDWSSDGMWLAIEGYDAAQKEYDIYLMNWESKALKKLTDTTYRYEQSPVILER